MVELPVQITDVSGTVVGSATMLEAFDKQLIRHVVYVMLIDTKGNYLLQQRSVDVPNYSGLWDASAGGHIDVGETPEIAAYRELAEELGVRDIALRHKTSFYFESAGDGRTYKYYAHTYIGNFEDLGSLSIAPSEVSGVALYTLDEIKRLKYVTPITRYIIDLL
ncbi:MAG TPA: NUDIX domain-containing protein [Candidatus Saccharibacteria bacterium]|nr:NUDIX domain-containing protein [Candidatus Saccharibacteria bacterium]